METFTFESFLAACKFSSMGDVSKMRLSQSNQLRQTRQDKRATCLSKRRNITDSPIPPTPLKTARETIQPDVNSKPTRAKRVDQKDAKKKWMERYRTWKQQREQAKAEARHNKKPIFRLGTKVVESSVCSSSADITTSFVKTQNSKTFTKFAPKLKQQFNYDAFKSHLEQTSTNNDAKSKIDIRKPSLFKYPTNTSKTIDKTPRDNVREQQIARKTSKSREEIAKEKEIERKTSKTRVKSRIFIEDNEWLENNVKELTSDVELENTIQTSNNKNEKAMKLLRKKQMKATGRIKTPVVAENNEVGAKTNNEIEHKQKRSVKKNSAKKTPTTISYLQFDEEAISADNELSKENERRSLRKTLKRQEKLYSEEKLREEATNMKSTSKKTPLKTSSQNTIEESGNKSEMQQEKTELVFKTPTKSPRKKKSPPKLMEEKENVDCGDGEEVAFITAENTFLDQTESTFHEMSSVYPMNNANDSNASAGDTITQAEKTPERTVYVSPFVTISRGKRNAREEFKLRKSSGGSFHTSPDATGIQAGGAYFYQLLSDEIQRMRELCTQWANYKDEENPHPDACDMINVAIGQANLLITKKMEQFRQLIDNNVKGCQGPSVTCADLHGFWDMVLIQVSNVIKRFDNLETMRSNEWEDILHVEKRNTPNVKPIKTKKPKRVMPNRKAKNTPSALSLAIREARKKKRKNVQVDENKEFDNSPRKSSTKKRKSLLRNVLDSGKGRRVQSPGFASVASPNSETITPGKSILKITTPVSSMRKVKNVLFKEDVAEVIPEHIIEENDAMKTPEDQKKARQGSRKSTPRMPVDTPRRSTRLSMKNLSNANNII